MNPNDPNESAEIFMDLLDTAIRDWIPRKTKRTWTGIGIKLFIMMSKSTPENCIGIMSITCYPLMVTDVDFGHM